jgi:tRNA pseudouridine55 synthase
LPILIGGATKVQDYLLNHPKTYLFEVAFGYETTTLDLEGEVCFESPNIPSEAEIVLALADFRGSISQEPPIYSAVKFQGKSLHKYARGGKEVDLSDPQLQRHVFIKEYELLNYAPPKARFEATCHKGTYVRCLARDLARKLGTYGTVTDLLRSQSSGIASAQTKSLEEVLEHPIETFLLPLDEVQLGLPSLYTDSEQISYKIKNGQTVTMAIDELLPAVKGLENFESACFPESLAFYQTLGVGHTRSLVGIVDVHLSDKIATLQLRRGLWT